MKASKTYLKAMEAMLLSPPSKLTEILSCFSSRNWRVTKISSAYPKPKSWNRSSHDFSLTPSSPPTCCPNTFDLLAFSGLAGPSFLISKMHKQPSSPVLKRYNLSKRHGDQASVSEKICLPRHSSQVMRIRETGAAWAYGKLYSSKELQRTLTQKNRATLLSAMANKVQNS